MPRLSLTCIVFESKIVLCFELNHRNNRSILTKIQNIVSENRTVGQVGFLLISCPSKNYDCYACAINFLALSIEQLRPQC